MRLEGERHGVARVADFDSTGFIVNLNHLNRAVPFSFLDAGIQKSAGFLAVRDTKIGFFDTKGGRDPCKLNIDLGHLLSRSLFRRRRWILEPKSIAFHDFLVG